MLYDNLLREAEHQGIDIYEKPMKFGIKGLYADNVIWINRHLSTTTEKTCILAEEIGHYHTTTGNTLDQAKISNLKQEKRARNWAYEKLIPLQSLVKATKEGVSNRYELAEFLNVTEDFLEAAIKHYKEKYGLYVKWTSYIIYFEPLGVLNLFED